MKRPFYRRLLSMNINAQALFPGLEGMGRAISERARFGAFWRL